jgi:hypothetical protein
MHSAPFACKFKPFYGSNLSGGWEGDTYIVYSYKTPIMVYSKQTCKWFMTKRKFSKTTSKHLSQVSFCVQPQPVTHEQLLQILIQPKYIPVTTAEERGIREGDLCRITHSNGVFRKGSVVRVESVNWWDTVNVSEVLAVRTKHFSKMYWNENQRTVTVNLTSVEKIHE